MDASHDSPPSGRSGPGLLTPAGEPRGERFGRGAHRTRLYAWAGITVALVIVLILLITANDRQVTLDWVVGTSRASLVWIIVVSTVLGWLLGICTSVLVRRRTRRR